MKAVSISFSRAAQRRNKLITLLKSVSCSQAEKSSPRFRIHGNLQNWAELAFNFIYHLHAMKPDTLWCFHHCGKQFGSSSIKQRLHVHALEKWNACYIESGVYVCVSLCVYIITFTSPSKKPFSVLGEFKHNDVLISLATTVTLEKLK